MASTKSLKVYNRLKKSYSPKHGTVSIDPYQYWGKVLKIVDGDTLDIEVEMGFNAKIQERFRLIGVNTPEIYRKKKDSAEYKQGVNAKRLLERLIGNHKWVELRIYFARKEVYGRWLCEIFVGKQNVNRTLISKGYDYDV